MKFKLFMIVLVILLMSCSAQDKKPSAGKQEVLTVMSKPFTTTLYYSGVVQPLKTNVITSPAEGVVQDMLFHYGDKVKAGDKLFVLSSEKFHADYKNALMQYIKAKNEFNTNKSQLMQSEFLHKNQLISDDEFKMKQSNYYNAQLGLVQAKEALQLLLKQLDSVPLNVDALNIENINKIVQAMHTQGDSQKLVITAPASGVVLLPAKSDSDGDTNAKKIGKGDQVKQGDVLAVIGDTSGLTVRVSASEFNINQLKNGQKVKVTGAAFPDYMLTGSITGIDRQALSNNNGLPTFPVEITVPKLTLDEQARIHIGMSTKVEINIEGEPQMTIPLAAVFEKSGKTFVNLKDRGKLKLVEVKTGATTLDSVVIESNLHNGDQIVFTR